MKPRCPKCGAVAVKAEPCDEKPVKIRNPKRRGMKNVSHLAACQLCSVALALPLEIGQVTWYSRHFDDT